MTILLAVLGGSLLVYRALGALGVAALATWPAATRWAMATLFLLTATGHFTRMKKDLVRMMPAWMPAPRFTVYATGVCEILGAIGLLLPQTARWAGAALILFLIAVFPANVKAARENLTLRGRPATPLAGRLPAQLLLIALLAWSTQVAR